MATAVLPPRFALGQQQLPNDDRGGSSSVLEQLLYCCVCHERLREPLLLECLHNCCRQCVSLIDAGNGSNTGSSDTGSHTNREQGHNRVRSSSYESISTRGVCPICYEPVNASRSRPDVFITLQLLSAITSEQVLPDATCDLCDGSRKGVTLAPHWCDDCGTALCDVCLAWHNRFHKRHQVITAADHREQQQRQQPASHVSAAAAAAAAAANSSVSSRSAASERHAATCTTATCELHQARLDFFCFTCQLLKCSTCGKTCIGARHDITALKDSRIDKYAEQQRVLLSDAIASADEQLTAVSARRSSTTSGGHSSAHARLEPERRHNVERLQQNKAAVLDATQKAYEQVEAKLLDLYERIEAEIDERELREMESLSLRLGRSLLYGRALLDSDCDDKVGMLNQGDVLLSRIRELASSAAAANHRASQRPADYDVLVDAQLPDDIADVIGRWIGLCRCVSSSLKAASSTSSSADCRGTSTAATAAAAAAATAVAAAADRLPDDECKSPAAADAGAQLATAGFSSSSDVSHPATGSSSSGASAAARPRDSVSRSADDMSTMEMRRRSSASDDVAAERDVGKTRSSHVSALPAEPAEAEPRVNMDSTPVATDAAAAAAGDGASNSQVTSNTTSGEQPDNCAQSAAVWPAEQTMPSEPAPGSARASGRSEAAPTPLSEVENEDIQPPHGENSTTTFDRAVDVTLGTVNEGLDKTAAAAASLAEQRTEPVSEPADSLAQDYSCMPPLESRTGDDDEDDLEAVPEILNQYYGAGGAASPPPRPPPAPRSPPPLYSEEFKEFATFDNLIADDNPNAFDSLSNGADASSESHQAKPTGSEPGKSGSVRSERPSSRAADAPSTTGREEMYNDIAGFDSGQQERSSGKSRAASSSSSHASNPNASATDGDGQAIRFGRAQIQYRLGCDCVDVSFTADGGVLLAAGEHGFLELDAKNGKTLSGWLPPYELAPLRDPWVSSVQLLEDGRVVVGMPTSPMLVVLRRHDVLPDEWVHDQSIMLRSHCVWRLATHGSLIAAAVCPVTKSLPVGGSPGNELIVVSCVGGIEQRLKLLYPIWSLVMTPRAVVTLSHGKHPTGAAAMSEGTGTGEEMHLIDAYSSGGQLLWRHASAELVAGLCQSANGRQLYLSLPKSQRVMALNADSGHPMCDVVRSDSHGSFSVVPAWLALREEPVGTGDTSSSSRRRQKARGTLAVLASDRRGLMLFPISS